MPAGSRPLADARLAPEHHGLDLLRVERHLPGEHLHPEAVTSIVSEIFLVSLGAAGASRRRSAPTACQPAFFDGFESIPDSGVKLATAEKALVDFLDVSPTRGRLFAAIPELEVPRGFGAAGRANGSGAFLRNA